MAVNPSLSFSVIVAYLGLGIGIILNGLFYTFHKIIQDPLGNKRMEALVSKWNTDPTRMKMFSAGLTVTALLAVSLFAFQINWVLLMFSTGTIFSTFAVLKYLKENYFEELAEIKKEMMGDDE